MAKQHSDPTDGSPKPMVTFGQQILIAVLVVAVGVLFGMGPVLDVLQQPAPAQIFAGISEQEVFRHQRTAERLSIILNPDGSRQGENFFPREGRSGEAIALELLYARLAEQDGLAPTTSQVGPWFQQWQKSLVPGSERITYGTALAQAVGTRHAVDPSQVIEFLRTRLAADAYRERHMTVPVAPPSLANDLTNAVQQRLVVRSVTLDSSHLLSDEVLAAAAADEHAVADLYDQLRDQHYRTPHQRVVTIYLADAAAIAERVHIDDASIAERYEALKDERFTIQRRNDDGELSTIVQPLEEVAGELREELAAMVAGELAALLGGRLRNALMEAGLAGKGDLSPADLEPITSTITVSGSDDPRLQEAVSLSVRSEVVVSQPASGETLAALDDLGSLDITELNLFVDEHGPGFLSAPYRPTLAGGERSDSHTMLLVTDDIPAGFRSLDEVRDEVVRYLATRQLYPEFFAEAQALVERARRDGLEAVFADEALQQRWQVQSPITNTLRGLEGLQRPVANLGDFRPEPVSAVALGAGAEAVQVVVPSTPASGEGPWQQRPRLRLIELVETEMEELNEFMAEYTQWQTRQQIADSITQQLDRAFQTQTMSVISRR